APPPPPVTVKPPRRPARELAGLPTLTVSLPSPAWMATLVPPGTPPTLNVLLLLLLLTRWLIPLSLVSNKLAPSTSTVATFEYVTVVDSDCALVEGGVLAPSRICVVTNLLARCTCWLNP